MYRIVYAALDHTDKKSKKGERNSESEAQQVVMLLGLRIRKKKGKSLSDKCFVLCTGHVVFWDDNSQSLPPTTTYRMMTFAVSYPSDALTIV